MTHRRRAVTPLILSTLALVLGCGDHADAPGGELVSAVSAALTSQSVTLQPSTKDLTMQGPCAPNSYPGLLILGKAAIYCYSYVPMIEFSHAALPAGLTPSSVISARLELHQLSGGTNFGAWMDFDAAAYPNRGPWQETGTNVNNAPAFDTSAPYENRIPMTNASNVWRSWNVTRAVQDWVGGTQSNQGFRIVSIENDQFSDHSVTFATRAYADSTLRPRLVVSFQPAATDGGACSADTECASGFCTGGICCNARCSDQACAGCDLPGHVGTCSPAAAGTTPTTDCSPYLCNGVATACPSSCVVDSCAPSYSCGTPPLQLATSTYFASDLPNGYRRGITLADVNGDGRSDAVVADAGVGVFVYGGNGDGTFAPRILIDQFGGLRSVASDFDGDGKLDIAHASYYGVVVSRNTSQAGGTSFGTPTYYASGGFHSLTVGDLNGDGKLDIAATRGTGSGLVQLLLGRGDGTFTVGEGIPVTAGVAGYPKSETAIGDLNGDGRPDLVAAPGGGPPVVLLNGGGTFATSTTGVRTAVALALSDLNRDGKLDIVAVDGATSRFTRYLGNGDGTFAAGVDVALQGTGSAYTVSLGDLNQDGRPDVAVGFNGVMGTMALLAGKGDGTFLAEVQVASYGYPFEIALGDVNGDGRPDVLGADYYSSNGVNGSPVISVSLNQTPGATCKKANGATCASGSDCASGSCADGVCCNSACGGGCDACSASLGASADGVCTVLATGAPSAGPSCGAYLCNGTSASCQTSCIGNAQCAGLRWCSGNQCVADTQPPVLTVPPATTVEASGPDGASVSYTSSANDNRDGTVPTTCAPASGSIFPVGTAAVTCNAVDASGNQGTATFSVIVRDSTPPVISQVPGDVVVEATGSTGAVATFSAPTASDVVDGAVTVTCTPPSGSTFAGAQTNVVTCTAHDHAGNNASVTFPVTVTDTTAPLLTLPDEVTVEAMGPEGALATFNPSASDLVDGPVAVQCSPAAGSLFSLGSTPVQCSAIDSRGNTASGQLSVTVVDTTAPALFLPAPPTIEATSPDGAVVEYGATTSDLVDGATAISCTPASGAQFPIGTTAVSCTSADARGNSATASFAVTVADTTAPALTIPGPIQVEANQAMGASATFVTTALDVVDGAVSTTCVPASGSTFPLGQTTVICSATDAHGNTASDSFEVSVRDTVAPLVTVPGPLLAEAAGAAGAIVAFVSSANDAVDGAVPTSCLPVSGSLFGLGSTVVICTATDAHNNMGSSSFVVVVGDTTPPAVEGRPPLTIEATSPSGAVGSYTSLNAIDLVDGVLVTSCTPASGTTFPLGLTPVICVASDARGNSASAQFDVLVADTTAPTLAGVPTDQIVEATSGSGRVVSWPTPTATDAVAGNLPVNCAPVSGAQFPIGTTTVHCNASDAAGNTASASFTTTVRDSTGPVFSNVPGPSAAFATSTAGAKVTYALPKATDAIDGARVVNCTPASGSQFPVNKTTVTCTASDSRGNTGTATFTVWVTYQAPTDGSFFLRPIRTNGSSIFRIGRPVPVRFQLAGASKGITNLVAKLVVTKLSNTVQGTTVDTSDESVNDTDLTFRYHSLLKFYGYRWKTSDQTQGTFELRADLGDGVIHAIKVSLRK